MSSLNKRQKQVFLFLFVECSKPQDSDCSEHSPQEKIKIQTWPSSLILRPISIPNGDFSAPPVPSATPDPHSISTYAQTAKANLHLQS